MKGHTQVPLEIYVFKSSIFGKYPTSNIRQPWLALRNSVNIEFENTKRRGRPNNKSPDFSWATHHASLPIYKNIINRRTRKLFLINVHFAILRVTLSISFAGEDDIPLKILSYYFCNRFWVTPSHTTCNNEITPNASHNLTSHNGERGSWQSPPSPAEHMYILDVCRYDTSSQIVNGRDFPYIS